MPKLFTSPYPPSWSEAIGLLPTHAAFYLVNDYQTKSSPKTALVLLPNMSAIYTTPSPTLATILITPISLHSVLFTYNQPSISNAFTIQQYHDLASALAWARNEPSIKVVVQSGAGKHYCAGKVLLPPGHEGPTIDQEIAAGQTLSSQLLGYPKVLIAAVHGAAIGWGCTQLFNFDLVYAWENPNPTKEAPGAVFQTPFTQLGFVPEGASSWAFPLVMGKQRANALLLASEKLSAREMYESGLVTKVLVKESKEAFLEDVKKVAERMGGFNGESLRLTKAQLNRPSVLAKQREAGMRERVDLQRMLSRDEAKKTMADFQSRKRKGRDKSKL